MSLSVSSKNVSEAGGYYGQAGRITYVNTAIPVVLALKEDATSFTEVPNSFANAKYPDTEKPASASDRLETNTLRKCANGARTSSC